MTVETSTNRVQYATNGTTGPFTVPFKFLANADLEVIYTDAAGSETTLTLTTNYSVTGAGDPSGGTVTTVTAYVAGGYITILRDMDYTQETDLEDGDALPAASLETALDKLTMLSQQIAEVAGRAMVFAPSDTDGSTLPAVAARADLLLGFDSLGRVSLVAPVAGSAAQLAIDIAASNNATKGAGQVGYGDGLAYGSATVGGAINRINEDFVSVFQYFSNAQIADVQAGTLAVDCAAAIVAAVADSKRLYFPPGKYRVDSTITVTGARGLVLEGAASALLASGTGYSGTTELHFDNATSGTNGLVITDFVGVSIKHMLIRMRRGGAGGGTALYMYNGHDYVLDHVKVDLLVGPGGGGIVLGNGTGGTATFAGKISNCKVMSNTSVGIYANFGTSLSFIANYVIGGWYQFVGMAYTTAISCACDSSTSYGYIINGCASVSFVSCGAEDCAKGAFYLSTTSSNIAFLAPYGAANNTSADATIGDLFQIDSAGGACQSITIHNPTSVSPNGATVQNIYANAGNGIVEVYGVDATQMSLGFGGNATWLAEKLSVTGKGEVRSWTPTLVNWTNVGSPTVVGKYVTKGNLVHFYVTITPATSISATLPTSTITGLPFTTPPGAAAVMFDGNSVSYGAVAISSATGIIYPQTSGVLTVPITISGTFMLGQ